MTPNDTELRDSERITITCVSIVSEVGLSPLYCGHFWPIVPTGVSKDVT
jgi:hypothetical protein